MKRGTRKMEVVAKYEISALVVIASFEIALVLVFTRH